MSDGQCLEVVQAAQLLSEGKPAAAIECLEAINTLDLDGHLLMAEALWTMAGPGGTRESLVHYQAAEAAAGSDISKRAAVALGHGWALMQLKDPSARKKLDLARTLAQQDGNAAAIQFVDGLLNNENADSSDVSSIESTWAAFVAASLGDQQGLNAILFMRGSIKEPEDERSALGVMKLKSAGVKAVKAVNVNESGPDLPGGLQTLSSLAVALPQLYLNGVLVESWLELDEAEFRDLLVRGGAEMNEMELSSFEAAPKSAEALEQAWEHLAPKVKERLEAQPEMPCGHSCNTCPTKHDCQLHDAVGHVRDIEDLA
ncbi:unnamed protein product [Durusdinium trenchii]|uniref:Uncharacterized protein n=1 Tax=Durusdinium trenchii TaxID=1381693 RepID=A0ABP0KA32_9DINO